MIPSSVIETVALFPCKSTTELSSTPHVEAMSWAYEERRFSNSSVENADKARLIASMVMRALASRRHPAPTHGVQSPSCMEPAECVHLPSAQMLQAVASKSPFQLPAGHAVQAEAPCTAL